jgi:type I restriction enzyme S subunit
MFNLVPKLRFPEFGDDWNVSTMEKLYSFKITNSFSRDKLNYKNGSVQNIHYGDIHTKFSTLFRIDNEIVPFINPLISLEKIKPESFCKEGDMVFADASEDLDDVGKSIEIVHLNDEKLLSGLHTILARQKNKKIIVGFGGYLFKSNLIRLQIKNESQGAKVLGISKGRLSCIEITYPSSNKEQQKIADCLSSLDNLITAHNQKHEALKTHKKGLMQKLFPQKGDKIPELRFKEFSDDWEEVKLSEITQYKNGGSFEKYVVANGKYYLITLNSININGDMKLEHKTINRNDNSLKKNDLIMILSDVAHGDFLGLTSVIPENNKYILNQRVGALKPHDYINSIFLSKLINLNQKYFKKHGQGSSQQNLSKGDVLKFKIKLPSLQEQQKIANCLSSIDNLISTQAEKITTLKAHKKGLMQQLFISN